MPAKRQPDQERTTRLPSFRCASNQKASNDCRYACRWESGRPGELSSFSCLNSRHPSERSQSAETVPGSRSADSGGYRHRLRPARGLLCRFSARTLCRPQSGSHGRAAQAPPVDPTHLRFGLARCLPRSGRRGLGLRVNADARLPRPRHAANQTSTPLTLVRSRPTTRPESGVRCQCPKPTLSVAARPAAVSSGLVRLVGGGVRFDHGEVLLEGGWASEVVSLPVVDSQAGENLDGLLVFDELGDGEFAQAAGDPHDG